MNTLDKILENTNIDEIKSKEEIATIIGEIAIVINGGCTARNREDTGTKPTAFVNFSGHTGVMYIEIHKTGWFTIEKDEAEYKKNLFAFCFFRSYDSLKEDKKELKRFIEFAKEII